MGHVPTPELRTRFDQWTRDILTSRQFGIAELDAPLPAFEQWLSQVAKEPTTVAPADRPLVERWIEEAQALLGKPSRLGRGIGSGKDREGQPAVIWVQNLERVIYGSKVAGREIPIPAADTHRVLGDIGMDVRRSMATLPKIAKTRAQKLACKNHAVTAIGLVVAPQKPAPGVKTQREFISGILTTDPQGEFALEPVAEDADNVIDYVSGALEKLDIHFLIENYLRHHANGSITLLARQDVANNPHALMALARYLQKEVYQRSPEASALLQKALDEPARVSAFLQFFYHSEQWMVQTLRRHLSEYLGTWDTLKARAGCKVYAMVLDFYSTNDVCPNCQEAIRGLVRNPNILLKDVTAFLQGAHYATSKNGIRLLVRVSASQWFAGGGRSADPAMNTMIASRVDIKTAFGNGVFLEAMSAVQFQD